MMTKLPNPKSVSLLLGIVYNRYDSLQYYLRWQLLRSILHSMEQAHLKEEVSRSDIPNIAQEDIPEESA